mmetsp:Transcript_8285/g.18734  ORF Transcript_8285/g.18734 Transcript_8285/m.18734 type:complete len:721 (-) Transcript_8285:33-2195(-)
MFRSVILPAFRANGMVIPRPSTSQLVGLSKRDSRCLVGFFHSSSLRNDHQIHHENLPDHPLVKVAILGPPNAGKSTLFNRLLDKEVNRTYVLSSEKKRLRQRGKGNRGGRYSAFSVKRRYDAGSAIVSSIAGTTRDRREGIGRIGGTYFQLVDTAGVDGERLDHFFDFDSDERRKDMTEAHPQKWVPGRRMKHRVRATTLDDANETTAESHITNPKDILRPMLQQALHAAREAHLILFMFDARVGLSADFHETCRWLRRYASPKKQRKGKGNTKDDDDGLDGGDATEKAILKKLNPNKIQRIQLLANKMEGQLHEYGDAIQDNLSEATTVGFGSAIPMSALHGEGVSDVCVIIDQLQVELIRQEQQREAAEEEAEEKGIAIKKKIKPLVIKEKPLQLAVLGRINVGKSTLINSLLRQERVITGPTPGLTRDAITIPWTYKGRPVQLVDTAGLRKKPSQRTDQEIEDMAVLDAMRAMKTADVALLVLDARALYLQRHEIGIAQAVLKEGRALVVIANKMDLLVNEEYTAQDFENSVRQQLEERFPLLRQTPIVAVSSLTGEAVESVLPVIFRARERWQRTIPTGVLNRWLLEVMIEQAPPRTNGMPTKIKYMIQTKGRPPTFLLFCNTSRLPESYLRYLTRHFQDSFEFFGMPVRLSVKESAPTNPFTTRKKTGLGIGGREARWERKLFKLRNPEKAAKEDRYRKIARSRKSRSKRKFGRR